MKCYIDFSLCMSKSRSTKIILDLRCWLLFFSLKRAFSKDKNRSGTSLLASFFQNFWRKIFSGCILLNKQNILMIFYTSWDIGHYVYVVIIYFSVCEVINFEINISFLIKSFSCIKCKYLKNEKSFWDEIKSIFPSFLKAFQLSEIYSDPIVDL